MQYYLCNINDRIRIVRLYKAFSRDMQGRMHHGNAHSLFISSSAAIPPLYPLLRGRKRYDTESETPRRS